MIESIPMPALDPKDYLSPTDFLCLQKVEIELSKLFRERAPLAAKLKAKSYTQAEFLEVGRLNTEIDRLEREKKALLDKNPLLSKNLSGFPA